MANNLTSKRAKACDISEKTKRAVFERDKGRCVVCGNSYNVMPNAHIVPRSAGGLGIETNIVTLCSNMTKNKCHYKYDFGSREERERIEKIITRHMRKHYGSDWSRKDQYYKKYDYYEPLYWNEDEEEPEEDDWF